MGDFVKGKNYMQYPIPIQKGLLLHRHIDSFTDSHTLISEAKKIFREEYHLFSGVLIDVLFDYYLSNDVSIFTAASLDTFIQHVYTTIHTYTPILTPDMKTYFGYMQSYNWLYNYKTKEGIALTLKNMAKRYPKLKSHTMAMQLFETHFNELQLLYQQFFPLLIQSTKQQINL